MPSPTTWRRLPRRPDGRVGRRVHRAPPPPEGRAEPGRRTSTRLLGSALLLGGMAGAVLWVPWVVMPSGFAPGEESAGDAFDAVLREGALLALVPIMAATAFVTGLGLLYAGAVGVSRRVVVIGLGVSGVVAAGLGAWVPGVTAVLATGVSLWVVRHTEPRWSPRQKPAPMR
ncbi:hypothetical protein [Cellulomonas bogoriensis]|uniref:Uncharacterized protein n=1 Tax=Cellulomonas bogoriensis 69B4 = DSM 16987 TaxID=1386082 RepID=A0A0A0C393_9CELL|nr:hypothetical protein [Cellulomonas bogoriensis]KGM13814.1 hypothetical protein N869_09325 [Cellulomonas bogoriensis 69B4 = DSM 16987]